MKDKSMWNIWLVKYKGYKNPLYGARTRKEAEDYVKSISPISLGGLELEIIYV